MKIGLIDVDGHGFPNLALMRISAWHKAQGDTVEWWEPPLFAPWYDIVYISKVFSDAYSKDVDDPPNAGQVIRGGTGYCISLVDGKEVFDESKNMWLQPEIERMFPDYSIYPQYNFAVTMTSRGCPRGCKWCIVGKKEGRGAARKVADVSDFWNGQPHIEVLDANITSCCEKRDLFAQYRETGATINFNQGLDIRLTDEADVEDLNRMRIANIHFAWDNPEDDLEQMFRDFTKAYRRKDRRGKTVYILTNFNSTLEQDLHRIYAVREEYTPYVMIYDKPHAPKDIKRLQRWCNSNRIIRACPDFKDYKR